MATWVNLMDVVYPVGSMYLSASSTSPSSTIGGTWTQIKGAVLAAYGANSFAPSGNYGGSLKISVNQMPSHKHYAEKVFWKPKPSLEGLDNTQTIFADDALSSDVVNGVHTYGSTSVGGGAKFPTLPLFNFCLAANSLTNLVGGYNG